MNVQEFCHRVLAKEGIILPSESVNITDSKGAGWAGKRYVFFLGGVRHELRDGLMFPGRQYWAMKRPASSRPIFRVYSYEPTFISMEADQFAQTYL